MLFKNLQVYRLPVGWGIATFELEEALERKALRPCGAQDAEMLGWIPPFTNRDELVWSDGSGNALICLGAERKLLPKAVVDAEVDVRAAHFEEQNGYRLGRKARRELADQVTSEFLPRAFTRRSKTFAWIDRTNGFLVVNAASPAKAEEVLEVLRRTLDSFPLTLLRTVLSPMTAMAAWLAEGEAPHGFTIDQDCSLRSISEDRKEVIYRRGLHDDQIREHLEAGCLPTKLALTFNDRISFVLTEKLEIKKVEFLDVTTESLRNMDDADAEAVFEAEFALMSGELVRLVYAVIQALAGELTVPKTEDAFA
jgi:recombination associated protein RdgC